MLTDFTMTQVPDGRVSKIEQRRQTGRDRLATERREPPSRRSGGLELGPLSKPVGAIAMPN